VFITSSSTMENNAAQRRFLASRGELISAVRLPNTAFKENAGTEVTTDIIILRKPDGMTEEDCRDLHICRAGGYVWSFWTPNAEELAALVVGGSVALSIMGETHPPLSVHATLPTEPFSRALTVEESMALSRTTRERNQALMDITKRIVAAWVRTSPDGPERRRLVDEFLDLATLNHGFNEVVRAVPVAEWAEQTATQADVDRYRADAEGWKAEAERWRKAAQEMTSATAVDEEMFQAAADLRAATDALGAEWKDISLADAITTIKSRMRSAEQEAAKARDAVRLLSTTAQELDAVLNPQFLN
jgi:hypothetical protein